MRSHYVAKVGVLTGSILLIAACGQITLETALPKSTSNSTSISSFPSSLITATSSVLPTMMTNPAPITTKSPLSNSSNHYTDMHDPFTFDYPLTWTTEGNPDGSINVLSPQTVADRDRPIPAQRTESYSLLLAPDITLSYTPSIANGFGLLKDYSGVKTLADILERQKDWTQVVGTTKVDNKKTVKVLEGEMLPHYVWYIESGTGLYIISFGKHIRAEALNVDEQKIIDSLKLLK